MQELLQNSLTSLSKEPTKLARMGGFRDIPLTEYVKHRLQELYREGAKLNELEERSGASGGFYSQVLGGTSGVGPKTADGLAPILGFKDRIALQVAAHAWWEQEGRLLYERVEKPEKHDDPEIAKAVTAASAVNVPRTVITETLRLYPSVAGKPWDWWIDRFAETQRETQKPQRDERTLEKKATRERGEKRRKIRAAGEEMRARDNGSAPSSRQLPEVRRVGKR